MQTEFSLPQGPGVLIFMSIVSLGQNGDEASQLGKPFDLSILAPLPGLLTLLTYPSAQQLEFHRCNLFLYENALPSDDYASLAIEVSDGLPLKNSCHRLQSLAHRARSKH